MSQCVDFGGNWLMSLSKNSCDWKKLVPCDHKSCGFCFLTTRGLLPSGGPYSSLPCGPFTNPLKLWLPTTLTSEGNFLWVVGFPIAHPIRLGRLKTTSHVVKLIRSLNYMNQIKPYTFSIKFRIITEVIPYCLC